MFAHQVIEDLNKEDFYLWPGIKNSIIENIRTSQQFHVGMISNIMDIARPFSGRVAFQGELSEVWLPYPKTWFDFIIDQGTVCERPDLDRMGKTSKFALLLTEEDKSLKLFSITSFNYFVTQKTWCVSPLSYSLSLMDALVRIHPMWDEIKTKVDLNNWQASNERVISQELMAVNVSLMLLNCKNIGTQKVLPSDKLNRKRIKSGVQPLFSYYTLTLLPTTRREKSIPKNLWHNRIHLCRGHFKTYTAEKPLFGSVTGRFWWQSHVKGQNRSGVVLKDYEIKTDLASSVTQMRST